MHALLLIQQSAPLGSLWGDYVKTMVILVGICFLALGVVKSLGPRLRENRASLSAGIRVLSRHPLEQRKNLYVVRAGQTTMLIATSGDSVHFMTQLEPSDFPEQQAAEADMPASTPMSRRFGQFLKDR